ncbi:hypothetical protein PIB30_102559, partial [Stylosanthes scabra]|nr:hypothetical protein [Stylosanthes scabra]
MRKESENERKREGVRFKGAGIVARSNGGPKMRLNGLAVRRARARGPCSVGPRAQSAMARTCHGHRAVARTCARAKRGARTRRILVLLRPNVIKLTARMRQGHRA